jgi:hypothetical protein
VSRLAEIGARTPAVTPAAKSRLAQLLETDLRGEEIDMPYVGRVWVELCPHDTTNEIEGATFAEMARVGLPPSGVTGLSYNGEQAKRVLAASVRELDKVTPVGSLEDWGKIDDGVINACWLAYSDVQERLDPIGVDKLTESEVVLIDDALEKKNGTALRRFGAAKLSLYLLTTADRRTDSPTPPSPSGESSPAS